MMNDRRYTKNELAIRQEFITLLQSKDLDQITVKEISDHANISRGTFYLHYQDTYELYRSIETEVFIEIEGIFDNAFPSTKVDNMIKLVNELTAYIYSHKNLLLIFYRHEGSEKTISKLKDFFKKVLLQETLFIFGADNSGIDYDAFEAFFIVSGIVGILEEWLKNDMDTSQEQIAGCLLKILMKLNGFYEKDEK
jgi:AcrR family transcriptional regulator